MAHGELSAALESSIQTDQSTAQSHYQSLITLRSDVQGSQCRNLVQYIDACLDGWESKMTAAHQRFGIACKTRASLSAYSSILQHATTLGWLQTGKPLPADFDLVQVGHTLLSV